MSQYPPHDDSLLSAYLDGQLDPERQLGFEAKLASDPSAADQLRALGAVRSLVAGLSRPTGPDLSSRIMADLEGRRGSWTRHGAIRILRAGAPKLAVAAGLAAAVVLAVTLSLGDGQDATKPFRVVALPPSVDSAPGGQTRESAANAADVARETSRSNKADSLQDNAIAQADLKSAHAKEDGGPVLTRDESQERIRRLLDDPTLRRVFLVTDRIGGSAPQQVAKAVAHTSHSEFYAITVAQGIVIDTEHPGEASVFAFVLNRADMARFQSRMKSTFGERCEEKSVDPSVVTQLADIGQVVSIPSAPGEVVIPGSAVALKAAPHERKTAELIVSPQGRERISSHDPAELEPRPEQELSAPIASLNRENPAAGSQLDTAESGNRLASDAPGPDGVKSGDDEAAGVPEAVASDSTSSAPGAADDRVVVLVWVTQREPG